MDQFNLKIIHSSYQFKIIKLLILLLPISHTIERLTNKLEQLKPRTRSAFFKPSPQTLLEQIDRMLMLIEQDKFLEKGKLSKSMLYIERAEILSSLGDKYGELTAWQQAALSEPDIETRSILEEIVTDLEVQLKVMKTQD